MQSIFGTDGIRGRFNKEITYSLAYKVGYALGSNLENNNPILIGRDTRISGDILLQAIIKAKNNAIIAFKFVFKSVSLLSDCIKNAY